MEIPDGYATWGAAFLAAWIPLFVAMDPIGLVPLFLGLTDGLDEKERRHVASQATITAAVVSIIFMLLGRAVFDALGITVADFQIAGGLIFFIIAAREILGVTTEVQLTRRDLGVVPLGTPLIAGPATLVALLMLLGTVGVYVTLAAFFVNALLVWIAFRQSEWIVRLVGIRGLRAFSKIIALLLAAYAVSMVRAGIQTWGSQIG
jgi:multiple antibiotic resistance protein